MPIDVGDAVLTMVVNTEGVGPAFDKVETGAAKAMGAADASTRDVVNALNALTEKLGEVGVAGKAAGGEIASGMKQAAHATREAKGEMALLGEATGIHIPRHIRSFVAELPGVGAAMSAAFSATAVLFLIDILVKGSEKLSEWIAKTFILTEAMKKQHEEQVALNTELAKHADEYKKVKEEVDKFGKSTLELSNEGVSKLKTKIAEMNVELKDAQFYIAHFNQEVTASPEKWQQYMKILALLPFELKLMNEQLKLAEEQNAKLGAAEMLKQNLAKLNLQEQFGKSMLALQKADSMLALTEARADAMAMWLVEKDYDEVSYQLAVASARDKLLVLKNAGKDHAAEVKAQSALIDNLEHDHLTKQKVTLTQLTAELNAADDAYAKLAKGSIQAAGPVDIVTSNFERGLQAANNYGVQLKSGLVLSLQTVRKEFDAFAKSGAGDAKSLKEFAQKVKDAEKALADFEKHESKLQKLFKGIRQGMLASGNAAKDFGKETANAFNMFEHSFQNAFAAYFMGEESLGAAMKKATQATLAEIGARCAIYALEYAAIGLGYLAVQNYTGADEAFAAAAEFGMVAAITGGAAMAMGKQGGSGGYGGGGSSPTSATGGAVVQQGQAPTTQTQNVLKLAAGGLVTGTTLAVIGDNPSRKEVVLPLDDPSTSRELQHAMGGNSNHITVDVSLGGVNMKKIIKQANRTTASGQGRIHAATSSKLVKRGS